MKRELEDISIGIIESEEQRFLKIKKKKPQILKYLPGNIKYSNIHESPKKVERGKRQKNI